MSRKIFFTLTGIISALAVWGIIFSIPAMASGLGIESPVTVGSLDELVSLLSGVVRSLVMIVLVMVIVYGGWVRLTARDSEEAVAKSSKIIQYALTGFVIIALAPIIVEFVGGLIGVRSSLVDT